MIRPPDLPPKPEEPTLPDQINLDLETAAMEPRGQMLRYTDAQVNAYLAYALKSKQAALSKYLKFGRVVVGFEDGYCMVAVERSLFDWPLYTTASFVPRLENGNVVAQLRAGTIGRLPVHPALMQYAGVLFGDVRTALDRERKSIAKLNAVEVRPKQMVLTAKAPAQAAPVAAAPTVPPPVR
jgi:hypothetical protein